METELATTVAAATVAPATAAAATTAAPATTAAAATSSNGSLAAVGTAAKAFILVHPLGVAAVGGAALALGTYFGIRKLFGKKKAAPSILASA